MKIVLLVVFVACMQVSAAVYSQKITLKQDDITLKQVFKEINKQTGYNVFWSPKTVKGSTKIDADFTDAGLEEVLKAVLNGIPATFSVEDKTVIIKPVQSTTTNIRTAKQEVTISGIVKDEKGNTLPGVSIALKSTTRGVVTDNDGKFTLKVDGPESIIIVTFVGYVTQEIQVKNTVQFEIILKESSSTLDEVAVVAFGTQKKSSMVSSIETINPGELKISSSNLTTALAGRLSGVIAYQRSGEPGRDNADFFIRGVTTFGYKRDPLILIDGIETTTTELARLQPDDIASFSILKDATATALYGARGANGVIQVATKQGTEGPAKISFRYENSYSMNTNNVQLADPITFMQMANEAAKTRDPQAPDLYTNEKIDGTMAGLNPYVYPATDWRKLLIKDVANNQRFNLNVNGGGQVARYYVAGSVNQDNGNLNVDRTANFNNNINLKSYQLRSNININLTKRTEMIVRLSGSFDDYQGPIDGGEAIYRKIIRTNPVMFPAYYPAEVMPNTNHILFGNATRGGGAGKSADFTNPYADLVRGYKDYAKSLLDAQFEMKQNLDFVTPGLSASGIFNTSRYSYFDVNRFYNPYFYNVGSYDAQNNTYTLALLNENGNPTEYLGYNEGGKDINSTIYLQANLIYNHSFKKHDVSGLLVYQRREQLLANQGSLQKSLPYRNQGLSGRFTYGYDNRYLLEFTFGYNGSERFYQTNRYGFFPAIGGGWVLSNEKFFEPLKNVVQKFKIRATYGLVGNDAIGGPDDRFFYLSDVNMDDGAKSYSFGENFNVTKNGVTIRRYENQDISWEKATKSNIGIELGLFNGLDIQVDYFTEQRSNILMDRQSIPNDIGLAATVRANVGKAKANGIDISVDYNKMLGNSLWIKGRGNFTYAHSEFVTYEEPDYLERYRTHVGQPLNQIYGLLAERLFVDEADVSNSPRQNFGEYGAGDIKYRDMNGDGEITDLDLIPIGYPTVPEIVYGFGVSAGYKGFDLSAFFQGSARSSFWLDASNTSPFQSDVPLLQAYADNHWSESNRDIYALWPRLSPNINGNNVQHYSTWFMRNGAFLRLKTLEFGYTLSPSLSKKLKMSSARIYASGINLWLLSGFDMWDIEMGGNGLGYPIQKVFNLGIQVRF
ncbi:MAG: SusC/RagA family TonB-linked outer membrane protein [Sphingobacteriaceae bacterium]|nr:MAG: SusC/RagA family TonB-linked outer membrane protein [Sphingobacteriaceae bacterium]